jgi:aldose sugar dehydrogenase
LQGERSVLARYQTVIALLSIVCLHVLPAGAQPIKTQEHTLRVATLISGLEHPWGLAFLPDGRMLITERAGRLRIAGSDFKLSPTPVSGLPPVAAVGQGGLMDVVLHPRFTESNLIYWSFAARGQGGVGTEVARGKLQGDRLEDVEVIFRAMPKRGGGLHFGSRLVFDRAGFLYITLGDRGDRERAQRLDEHAGKIIRLHDDGKVPADNPFAKQSGARPEIFSVGHRNVQGAALHPESGALWTHEHGPQGGDEINSIAAGVNYGWPEISYGVEYGSGMRIGHGTAKAGMAQPIHTWSPSIAPSGMAFYRGSAFSRWQGDLLVGALAGRTLARLRLQGDKVVHEERLLTGAIGRIRDVRVGPDGFVYLLIDHGNGALVRVETAP